MNIHPSAIVDPSVRIGSGTTIGPLCVIERDVRLGEDCHLAAHVVVKNGTVLGPGNLVFEGPCWGLPQHVNIPENPGRLVIGAGNTIRENVTFHRALQEDGETIIGDNNLFMVNTHIAHDCRIGNHTIFTNNSMLAGHVTIGDRPTSPGRPRPISSAGLGVCHGWRPGPHQQGCPPFVTLDGLSSHVVGLNSIGLRRAGFTSQQISQLKEAYRVIYRSGLCWNDILQKLQEDFTDGPAAQFYQFLSTTTAASWRNADCRQRGRQARQVEETMPRIHTRAG